jgi:hypothetical protein
MKIITHGKEIPGDEFNTVYIDKNSRPGFAVLTVVTIDGSRFPVATYLPSELCMAWYMLKRIARSVFTYDEDIDVDAVANILPTEEIMEKFNIDYGTRDEIRLLRNPEDEEVRFRVALRNSIYENYMKGKEKREEW